MRERPGRGMRRIQSAKCGPLHSWFQEDDIPTAIRPIVAYTLPAVPVAAAVSNATSVAAATISSGDWPDDFTT